jgi:hypothetical protein
MSDFLTNLAARALAAPSLRPRTRSRFEPAPDSSPWSGELPPATTGIEAEAATPPARPRAPATRASAEQNFDLPIAAAVPPAPRTRRPPRSMEETIAEPQPQEQPAASLRPRRDEPASGGVPLQPQAPTTGPAAASPNDPSHTIHTTERLFERVVERHDTTIRIETANAPDAPAAPRRDASVPHRHDEQPPSLEREQRLRPEIFAMHDARPAPRQRHAEAPAAPDPVIHVSIGRVEVRAVTPAAPPPRARMHNAPMTIEEYAARRNAKGRP